MSTKKKAPAKKAAKKKTTAFDEALIPPASKTAVEIMTEDALKIRDEAFKKLASLNPELTPEGRTIIRQQLIDAGFVAVEPMEATGADQIEGGEPWPNYSPFPEEEDTGPGFSPANIQPVTEEVDEVVESWNAVATGPNEPVPMDEPVLGSGSPVEASDPISGTNMSVDASKTITDLIDGMNYLFKLAVTIRGPRGLKQHDEPILRKRVAAARQLLANLK